MRTVYKIVIAISIFLLVYLLGGFIAAKCIYDAVFGHRYETSEEDAFDMADFPELSRTEHRFLSNGEHTLAGYLYESEATKERQGVVIFSHGMGNGGQRGYIDFFDVLAAGGYYVFAYDATGNDESEGDSVGSLLQGVIDLSSAIDYVKGLESLRGLPLSLVGYSWGAMSLANVLCYQDGIDAVVSIAGWNESRDMIIHKSKEYVGPLYVTLLPQVGWYEEIMYGEYSAGSSLEGLGKGDTRVMIIHGDEDATIPTEYGYDKYFAEWGADERFEFVLLEGRGHNLFEGADGGRNTEMFGDILEFLNTALAK